MPYDKHRYSKIRRTDVRNDQAMERAIRQREYGFLFTRDFSLSPDMLGAPFYEPRMVYAPMWRERNIATSPEPKRNWLDRFLDFLSGT
jgi:hypothetical protein